MNKQKVKDVFARLVDGLAYEETLSMKVTCFDLGDFDKVSVEVSIISLQDRSEN